SETMLVNQSPVTLDTPPIIIDSRTLVPLRAIAEAFHIAVNWDNEKFAVNIITGAESLFGAHTEKSFSLLNDLLKVDLPDFSQYYIAMPYGIMGPESSNEEETHIIIEKNGQKLALYVEELFNKASVNLGDDAKKILTVTKGIFESPVANGKVENVKLIPDVYEGDDGIIVRKALIRTQDNLLVYAAVFADPETFGETKDDCIKMAESIIDSIGEGTRQINRQPHEESLSGFTISLQQDYILTYQLGPDFSVYYIRKLVNVGEIQPYMGVYFGNFPSYDGTKSFIAISGKTLGQNINWHQEARTIDTDTQIETLVKINDDGWAQYMHIFVYPGTESDWNELKQMAESLTPEN
ncbi:MAG: copper amine oxidase N-terminal domain-containing protein, partial [Firmicutes bacterium]|nr:copper amine oxidase N-terminal domain-containing protein [Bacillota bacterium]